MPIVPLLCLAALAAISSTQASLRGQIPTASRGDYAWEAGAKVDDDRLSLKLADEVDVEFRGGVLHSPFESRWLVFEIEANWFGGEIDDAIAFTLVSPQLLSFQNTGRARTRGHELLVRWRPHEWLRLSAARTVTDAKIESNDTRVPGIARSQIDARIEVGPRDRFKLVGELQYTGDIYASLGEQRRLDSRVLYDASARVDITAIEALPIPDRLRSLWLIVRGRNLGNIATRDAAFYPRPGRTITFTVEGAIR